MNRKTFQQCKMKLTIQRSTATPTRQQENRRWSWYRVLTIYCISVVLYSSYFAGRVSECLTAQHQVDDIPHEILDKFKKYLGQENTTQRNQQNQQKQMKHKSILGTLASKSLVIGSPIFQRAVQECNAAYEEYGAYPSVIKQLIALRQLDWNAKKFDPIVRMASEKLGDKVYANKLGVRAPKIYFCGQAKELPRNISSIGDNFVLKPINGWSAKGVKVVVNGRNKLAKNVKDKKLLYKSLIDEYGKETFLLAEELVENARPELKGLVPPDYKFFVFGGQVEYLAFVDRNQVGLLDPVSGKRVRKCARYLYIDNVDRGWKAIPGGKFGPNELCDVDNYGLGSEFRNAAMIDTVQKLAAFLRQDYLRIDMFDSKDGPMLGEFTPFSLNGLDVPLTGCIQSYMFIQHAAHSRVSDDARFTLSRFLNIGPKLNHLVDDPKKLELHQALSKRILSWIPANWTTSSFNDTAGRNPTPSSLRVAGIWSNLTMQEKCDEAMRAQREYWDGL